MQRRKTSCSTGRGRRIIPTPGPLQPWDEQVPRRPGRDATLLAVVPIPGTGTSLAIVGYAITTSAADPAARPRASGRPAIARRRSGDQASPGHGLLLDHAQRRVWIDGREIQLTFQEFELLAFLAAHPAIVFTRRRTSRASLAPHPRPGRPAGAAGQPHRGRAREPGRPLRRKLGPRHGQCLVTEYRVGYQFRPRPA